MSTDKEMGTDVKPKKTWLRFLRGHKISHSESGAAPQEAEEHRDSCAGPESRAAAPHGPSARGPALLRCLRRGSRAVLSRVPAVIRRHSQQPGAQQHLHRGTEAVTAAAAPAAGAESRAAAPHSPCCPPSPSPGQLGALGGQGTGPAVGAVLATSELEKSWFSLEEDLEVEILPELPPGDEDPEEGCSGEQRPPVRPRQAWVEHRNLFSRTTTGQASPVPRRAPHSWPEVSTSKTPLGYLPPGPPLSQVEAGRQWAVAAERVLLPGMVSEEGDTSEDVQAGGSGDESAYVSRNYELRHLEPCKGTGLLERSPQTGDQSAAEGEDRSVEELFEKWNVFPPHAIWVMPRGWYTIHVDPDSSSEEEADADVPGTSGALAAARDAQPAAAALAGAHEDEEHPVRAAAQAQEVAKAAAESRAVTLHGPSARGPALLRWLRRGSRAVQGRVAAVIRRHSQQPGTQQHLHQGTEAVNPARAPSQHHDQSWGTAEQRPPVKPRQAWV